jgi:hypothetical protein
VGPKHVLIEFKKWMCYIDGQKNKYTRRTISSTKSDAVAKLQQFVHQDEHRIIQDFADEIAIGYGTCQRIMAAELGTLRVAAKFVPNILTADQIQQCVRASSDRLRRCNLPVQCYQWWQELDLRLWPWDKATILPMEKFKLIETIATFHVNCLLIWEDSALNFGDETTGCCMTATCRLKLPFSPRNVLLKTWLSSPPTLLFSVSSI